MHDAIGTLGWTAFHARLAETFAVTAPDMPGYGRSARPDWAAHPRDEAVLSHLVLDRLGLDRVHPVGLGFGRVDRGRDGDDGPAPLASLTIVCAPGLRPREGEIFDWLLMSYEEEVRFGFRDDDSFEAYFGREPSEDVIELWDYSREMTVRLSWKPWMHSLQLPFILPGVDTPALVVWGRHDRFFPLDCGKLYAELLGDARLEIIEDAGHYIGLEQPERLAQLIVEHARAK